jgi:ribosome biogenesis SPOUT family RNA methylase Rps3
MTVLYIFFLFTDAELGVSSVPLCNGQIGSDTAIKLASTVVQDMNLNELEKMQKVFFPLSLSPH